MSQNSGQGKRNSAEDGATTASKQQQQQQQQQKQRVSRLEQEVRHCHVIFQRTINAVCAELAQSAHKRYID